MPLALNEEQRLLQDTAREFLAQHAPVSALRELRDSGASPAWSADLWQQMAELGWAGITLPEAYGGLEFGYLGLGGIIEETGRRLTASPLISTVVLGASLIERVGTDAQKESLLPAIVEGTLCVGLALDEGPHHRPTHISCRAERSESGWTLSGEKQHVVDGNGANTLLVVARISGDTNDSSGLGVFLVPADTAGLQTIALNAVDSRDAANIVLDNVSVSADALLGDCDDVWPQLEPVLDRGRIALAAEMLGSASEAFERTVDYLKERKQFGAVIGSFQALKHRAAKMHIELELARSVVLDALSAIDENRDDLGRCASHAKAFMGDLFDHIANEAVQLHGGIGVTDELDIGFFLKRARVAAQLLGDSGYHKDRFGRLSGF